MNTVIEGDRKGDWFQTHSGQQFWPQDPRPGDFLIDDIATGLSNVCRFGGQVKRFYSVAQHSILVSKIVPEEIALEALLHDASEAYLGDVIRPLKSALPEYRKIERKCEEALAEQFGLTYPWPKEVKDADNCLLMTERRDVLAVHREWSWRADPLPDRVEPWDPTLAKTVFLYRYLELSRMRAKS